MLSNVWLDLEIAHMKHDEYVESAERARLGEKRAYHNLPSMQALRTTIGGWLVAVGQYLEPPAHLHKRHEC